MAIKGGVELAPITPTEVAAVGHFLHRELNPRLSAEEWAASVVPPWSAAAPNHGFLLRAGSEVLGVHLAYYSERFANGRRELVCNLGAWCVAESHRLHSVRLLRALLAQPGYTFTDLSPSGNVVGLNKRLKFEALDTTTMVVLNLPWPVRRRGVRVLSTDAEIQRAL